MTTLFYAALLVLGLVLLVVTVVRVLVGGLDRGPDPARSQTGADGSRARGILDERYAAGELSTEEYRHRLRVLEERNS
jgi:putative membrane protein